MFIPMNHVVVHLWRGVADMRWGYDRLAGLCREQLGLDPYSGQLFLFVNRPRDRAKVFYYDGSGSCLFMKRMEVGTFQTAAFGGQDGAIVISASQLMLLLSGQTLQTGKAAKAWQPSREPP